MDAPLVAQVNTVIEALATNPRPSGCKKLQGTSGLWRIRSGSWRIVYSIDDASKIILILAIGDRKEVYR